MQKIHCPICHGTGKVSDTKYGNITCLNCLGKGIVDLNNEQQKIIDDIYEKKRRIETEKIRKEQEALKAQHEHEKQQLVIQKIQQESDKTSLVIGLIIAALVIGLIVIFWHEIIAFLWELIKGFFTILLVLGVCAVMISMVSNND